MNQQDAFCTPRKQDRFLKLSLSFGGVHVEKPKMHRDIQACILFPFSMLLFFQCCKNRNGQQCNTEKDVSYFLSQFNELLFLLNSV